MSTSREPVFLDTVGLLALWDRSDQWHLAAETSFAELKERRTRLVTTSFILLECGNAAARSPYREFPNRLRMELERAKLLVVPNEQDWGDAWAAYQNGGA